MLEIKKTISLKIAEILKEVNQGAEISAKDIEGMLEYPPDEKMGDLALPCFKMSRTLRKAPVKIALEIAEGFSADCVSTSDVTLTDVTVTAPADADSYTYVELN